jgi:hypothetical protein
MDSMGHLIFHSWILVFDLTTCGIHDMNFFSQVSFSLTMTCCFMLSFILGQLCCHTRDNFKIDWSQKAKLSREGGAGMQAFLQPYFILLQFFGFNVEGAKGLVCQYFCTGPSLLVFLDIKGFNDGLLVMIQCFSSFTNCEIVPKTQKWDRFFVSEDSSLPHPLNSPWGCQRKLNHAII